MSSSRAKAYARVLEHAPVLVGSAGGFVELGRDSAVFVAAAIEPYLDDGIVDHEGVTERLLHGKPPALGDGGRALTPLEVERIVHVCDLLMLSGAGVEAPLEVDVIVDEPIEPDEPVDWTLRKEEPEVLDGFIRRPDLSRFDPTREQNDRAREVLVSFAEAVAYRELPNAEKLLLRILTSPETLGLDRAVTLLGSCLRSLDTWYRHPQARPLYHEAIDEARLINTDDPMDTFLAAAAMNSAFATGEEASRSMDVAELFKAVLSATTVILLKYAHAFTGQEIYVAADELFKFEDDQRR